MGKHIFFKNFDSAVENLDIWFEKEEKRRKIIESQYLRFEQKFNTVDKIDDLIEKVLKKYNSKEYRDKCYNQRIEPTNDLLHFFKNYANYIAKRKDPDYYSDSFKLGSYRFTLEYGQGTTIFKTKKQKTKDPLWGNIYNFKIL